MLLAQQLARAAAQRGLSAAAAATSSTALAATHPRLFSTSNVALARPVDTPSATEVGKKQTTQEQQHEQRQQESGPPKKNGGSAPAAAPRRAATAAFDIDTSLSIAALPEGDGEGGKRTGARARTNTTSQERQSRQMMKIFGALGVAGAAYTISTMGREWETIEEREKYGDDPKAQGFFGRLRTRVSGFYSSVNAPQWEHLLPDPLPFPYQRPYTLVLDLDKLLVSSSWTRKDAWRTAKRPGLDYFLAYLSQWYEIVLFTRQPFYVAGPIVEKLDPDRRYVAYTLYRESCRTTENGHVVKDISHLNRDPKKVVVLDTDPEAFELQPENGILVKPWNGEKGDVELVGLIPFLEAIGIYNIDDVRKTIQAYEGTHIPTEHMRRQREIKQAELEEWQRKQGKGGKLGFFGGLRGEPAADPSAGPPKTWYEQERERYLQGYLEDQKYWAENGEALRRQAKEEQDRQIKEMKLSAWGMITGQGMKPPGGAEEQGGAAPADAPAAGGASA